MQDAGFLKAQPIAHRGYHDINKTIWENTLSAAARAVEAGFAIECDVQYSADSVPVVFHDDDMERLCGVKGDIRAKTAGELGLVHVGGTADKVPTLRQLLRLVKGRVPVIVELKGRAGDDEGFAASVLESIEDYRGPIALMSFDHWLLADLKGMAPPCPIGLTAEGNTEQAFSSHAEAMALGLDFVSYHYGHLPNPFVTQTRDNGIPVITWTVRDEAAMAHTFRHADQMTFEGFDPRTIATA